MVEPARSVRFFSIVIAALFFSSVSLGETLEMANEAYDRGDHTKAIEIVLPLALNGNRQAQFNLGTMYDFGLGVATNHLEAVKWYRKAAERGHVSAQFNLAVLLDRGLGVERNDVEALYWYTKAGSQGHAKAHFNAANKLWAGEGVAKNVVAAYVCYALAAQLGIGDATEKLTEGLINY